MVVEIKSIKIKVADEWDTYKNFNFIIKENLPCLKIRCSSCLQRRIDYTYFYIIDKLDKANLLPENFKMLCCGCTYIIEKLGFARCLDCKNNLDVCKHTERIRIYCFRCGKIYHEIKLPKKIIDNNGIIIVA